MKAKREPSSASVRYIYFERPRVKFLLPLMLMVWGVICSLYALHLSDLLESVPYAVILLIGFGVPATFIGGYAIASRTARRGKEIPILRIDRPKLIRRTKGLTVAFVLMVATEFAIEGYVPLISMARGAGISHFEFGIPSVHGLILSLGALLFTTWFTIWHLTGSRSAIAWAGAIVLLFVLLVTRKMMLVSIAQAVIVTLILPKYRWIYFKYGISAFVVALIFGWVGDIRTGREIFLNVSHFNIAYPEWLPTGFGWIYIYITTPIANFGNAILTSTGASYDFSFLAGLFPRMIRAAIFHIDVDDFAYQDWQISSAFNVGTGFVEIFQSLGLAGVGGFLLLLGWIFGRLSRKVAGVKNFLALVVFSQCTIFLVFGNNFFNLNTVSQFIFIVLLFGVKYRSGKAPNSGSEKPISQRH